MNLSIPCMSRMSTPVYESSVNSCECQSQLVLKLVFPCFVYNLLINFFKKFNVLHKAFETGSVSLNFQTYLVPNLSYVWIFRYGFLWTRISLMKCWMVGWEKYPTGPPLYLYILDVRTYFAPRLLLLFFTLFLFLNLLFILFLFIFADCIRNIITWQNQVISKILLLYIIREFYDHRLSCSYVFYFNFLCCTVFIWRCDRNVAVVFIAFHDLSVCWKTFITVNTLFCIVHCLTSKIL